MNERIEKLAKQCYVKTGSPHTDHFEHWKFAELMVIEFTESVKETATRIAQTGFNDGLSMEEVNKRVNSALFVLEVMRERFGVE